MNTPNTAVNNNEVVNVFNLTALQLMRLVASSDTDASEFGTRFVKYLGLVAKNNRTQGEQKDMETLLGMTVNDFSEPAFRGHLAGVLNLPAL